MSLKIKLKTPRAMPAEAVLTRSKLAQLKQNKTQKNVKLCPENESLRLKNGKRNITVDKVQCKEFQPDKVKRKIELKRVKLNPNHNQIVIADMTKCNKRKRNVPKRDFPQASFKASTPPRYIEKSVFELITLMDGTQEMCDDDLLEILTCPSPVWWEDPPPGYSEDPISVEYIVKKEKLNVEDDKKEKLNVEDDKKEKLNVEDDKKEKLNVEDDKKEKLKMEDDQKDLKNVMNNIKENLIEEPNTSVHKNIKNDVKYVNKSKNLEVLLGNIKNKKHKNLNVCDKIRINEFNINNNKLKENNEVSENAETMKTDVDNKSKNEIKPIINELKPSNLEDSVENIKEIENLSENTFTVSDRSSPLCIELNSDETDHEDPMNVSLDDGSLFFLENIEIPIVNEF
ncbi:uncharacterized protein LOC125061595 [Pieris napi]|uniref:uncharacterized protein LOC125061595 n=1 Tax=Pieris napi TaxID=78633 RepID=UPI001FBADAEE|nr:uncharacterized protein LOC125061595 [Pieris napi]XP_047523043.1 uncharacterized protein LOC125061595 [Pieris napi]XP_047523044.1 uncharacterized protein LOC125061595 [Pieris napi]XP_047523045.1 uncharacterized protein LOC125061595 [Pieris napi]